MKNNLKSKNSFKSRIILAAAFFVFIVVATYFFGGNANEKKYELSEDLKFTFSNADDVITSIREALKRHDVSITINCESKSGHMESIESLVGELVDCALYDSMDPEGGDYIRYQYGGYKLDYTESSMDTGYAYEIVITPEYYTDLSEEEDVDDAIGEALSEIGSLSFLPEYEKVKRVYDYLIENVEYDSVRKNHDGYHKKATAYAALVNKSAVCQGYAVAMYRLLKEVGVDCRVITGTAEYDGVSEYHAWNIVKIGDGYYNLDVTWDKLLETDAYFLKSDEDFGDHTRDEKFDTEEFRESYPMYEESLV